MRQRLIALVARCYAIASGSPLAIRDMSTAPAGAAANNSQQQARAARPKPRNIAP